MRELLRKHILRDVERSVMVMMAVLVAMLLVASGVMAGTQLQIEAESGQLSAGAATADSGDASGGKYVTFNSVPRTAAAPAVGSAAGAQSSGGTSTGGATAKSGSTGSTGGSGSGSSSGSSGGGAVSSSWPADNNTGYPHGLSGDTRSAVTLSTYTGPCTISSPTTINAKDISCELTIASSGVVIKNSRIRVSNSPGIQINDVYHALITDTEIDGQHADNSAGGNYLIGYGSYTCIRCNLHGSGDILRINWGGVAVIDSWLHDPYCIQGSCHNDVMQSTDSNCTNGVDGIIGKVGDSTDTDTGNYCVKIVHDRMENSNTQTSNILLKADQGPIHDVLVENNLFNGGGYSFYWYDANYQVSQGIVRNNRFRRSPTGGYWPNGGYYGPVAVDIADPARNPTWTNNVWDDTGAAIGL